ncbi:MAG: hypothetical protein L0G49_08335 [Luteococcus sp.]|uniref:glycosyltransferase n=1 Tax=Luteococcus sp. TaxID=1969402 RepID=UPI00264805F4|nr:glycosyltransferase [Luteococcus sp.]MDN5563761.1 hypothetical protein [Luteococcus sp.]
MTSHASNPAIFATIGTDHHQFRRIIDWIDDFLDKHPDLAGDTVVQHGQSPASRNARNTPFIEYKDLMETMRHATAVVTHGGPASIFESRAQGRLPIVVPRDPALHEIVDEHQQRFARHLAADGLIVLCETQGSFFAALEAQLADPASAVVVEDGSRIEQAMNNLEAILQGLEHQPPLWRRFLPSLLQK